MKRNLWTIVKGILAFILLMAMIIVAWSVVLAILKTLNEEISKIDSAIVLAGVSAVASIVSLMVSKKAERQALLFVETKKVNQPVYQDLIKEVLSTTLNKKELKDRYLPFIITHSSDKILKAFTSFCDDDKATPKDLIEVVRKELNLTNKTSK